MRLSDNAGKNPDNPYPKLKPYSDKELSVLYTICPRTLKKWLAPHLEDLGPRRGRFYTIVQVKKIVDWFGYPN